MEQLPALMTIREVASALRLNRETVRRWIAEGRISAVPMPGRAVRIRREVVEQMLGVADSVDGAA
jgi:excisionase family DNA binding protein